MDKSVFTDKQQTPGSEDLAGALGKTFEWWKSIVDDVLEKDPAAQAEWHYAGEKYGWSFRIKDKKRTIVYMLPRENYFKVAFVFGQKATDELMNGPVAPEIKKELAAAKVYAEGRGIRIDVTREEMLQNVRLLIDSKLNH